jgi:choline monooxygenase
MSDSLPNSLKDKLAQFNGELPLERASTIPRLWYSDTEIYQAESRAAFARSWQAVGRVEQLSENGQFITAEIAGEPVVVTRDKEGTLRAFTNVCRHRAARVALGEEGKASFFQCHYHGWTYDLTGQLKGTPEFAGVCEFDREANALPPWQVATWGPLVFVRQSANGPSLQQYLAPLPEKTSGLGLDKMKFVQRKGYDLECNWKVFVDNYLDGGYHVNTIHPALGGVIDYSHYRTEVFERSSVQISPLKPGDVSSVRGGDTAYYWWVFPNLMLNIYDGLMDTNLVLPMGPNRCRVLFDFYFVQTEGEKAKSFMAESIRVADQVQDEDLRICEEVQRGLSSQTYDTGRFSVRREIAGYHFHRLLGAELRGRDA